MKSKTDDPNLWSDPEGARTALSECAALENTLSVFDALAESLNYYDELYQATEEEDQELFEDIKNSLAELQKKTGKLETEVLFSGEADGNDCFVEINSGAGGVESNDWSAMLMRMYMRWAEGHNFEVKMMHEVPGEEAGVKSITLKISGKNAYGWAKTESGVHRLVRISPFDSNSRRHTSFASVWVYPVADKNIEIEIDEKDIRVDTYRASGAGGQHINKTDSAVRITHLPTNIAVQCQSTRSQHRNRIEAYNMLKSRLYELKLREREAKILAEHSKKQDISWGSQIRSYVLQPYQMVKDLRTDHQTSNIAAVLDGGLDDFINAALVVRCT